MAAHPVSCQMNTGTAVPGVSLEHEADNSPQSSANDSNSWRSTRPPYAFMKVCLRTGTSVSSCIRTERKKGRNPSYWTNLFVLYKFFNHFGIPRLGILSLLTNTEQLSVLKAHEHCPLPSLLLLIRPYSHDICQDAEKNIWIKERGRNMRLQKIGWKRNICNPHQILIYSNWKYGEMFHKMRGKTK
jgi:hypothetical protein